MGLLVIISPFKGALLPVPLAIMMRRLPFVLLASAYASSDADGMLPRLELSLAPDSLPALANQLAKMTTSHDAMESEIIGHTRRAGMDALKKAHQRMRAPVAFLEQPTARTVNVHVQYDSSQSGADLADQIAHVGAGRDASEKALLEQSVSDIHSLVESASSELEAAIAERKKNFRTPRASFLAVPTEANIQVVGSDDAFPTGESLARELDSHRAVSQELALATVAMQKLDTLRDFNKMAREMLRSKA